MKHLDDLTETLKKLKRQDMLKKLSLSSPIAETEKSTEPRELLSPNLSFSGISGIQLDSRHTSACPSISDGGDNRIIEGIEGNTEVPASSQNDTEGE